VGHDPGGDRGVNRVKDLQQGLAAFAVHDASQHPSQRGPVRPLGQFI
jgi:hypothetical protein